jgi:hypothetical protein
MTKIQELEQDLIDIQSALDAATNSGDTKGISDFTDAKKEIEDELAVERANQSSIQPTPPPMQRPMAQQVPMGNSQAALDNIVRTIAGIMNVGSGTGVDSAQLQAAIDVYLQNNKISLTQLDQDILDEIKKNQIKVLEIPEFAKKLTIDSKTAAIPNFFDILDDILAGNNVYLIGEAGGGKAQPLTAKILCKEGWKTFADIKVGDKVFGEDGNIHEVSGVFDRGNKSVYRCYMNDGAYTDTCDEHLWHIFNRNGRSKNRHQVLKLSDFMYKLKTKDGYANAYIPIPKNISFSEKHHVIHPYTMGVLLGDGGLTVENAIIISNPSEEIFENLILPLENRLSKNNNSNNNSNKCLSYRIIKSEGASNNVMVAELKKVGLSGKKSIDKFIPKEYLYDSFENRVELLQGLNDTDGYTETSHFEYSTSSLKLAEDYCELVRGLGGYAKATKRTTFYTYNGNKLKGQESYRISCVFPDNVYPFKLSEKAKKFKHPTKYKVKRFFDRVEYMGDMDVRCISVTNPSRLYITDNYIVTHNTYTAEVVAKTLQREYVTLNCSQYTSPLEILGGQSVDGFKQGKLIDCWKNGKILIMDEMPKLDPNTAGLFNDALAKSSKTRPDADAKINSANPDEAPISRAKDFGIIATGNIYPNSKVPTQYRGNNQQDLSLLDRFSGSVYYTEFDNTTDQIMTRFKFLYDFLVGNYYEFINAKKNRKTLPTPRGLRTIISADDAKNLALVSYRTEIAFRVAFEFQLVRAIAKKSGQNVEDNGKTLLKTFQSYMVAFRESTDKYDKIIRETGYTDNYIQLMVDDAIKSIISTPSGFLDSLNDKVKETASPMYQRYEDFYVGQAKIKP